MTNIFSDETNALEAVKTKYGNDPEKMLQALVHSQTHIAKIEAENADYKTNAVKAKSVEEILAALQSRTPPPQAQVDQPQTPSVLDENTLRQKVLEVVTQQTAAEKAQNAANEIQATLVNKFGDESKANTAVKAKALELGLSTEALGEFALKSPKAFYKLFDISEPVSSPNLAPTRGTVNPQAVAAQPKSQEGAPGTPAYYDKMRRENYTLWKSAKVQNEIMAEAMKDPAKFGINI